jgi:hypothetical protein
VRGAGEQMDDEETAHSGIREADLAELVGFPIARSERASPE